MKNGIIQCIVAAVLAVCLIGCSGVKDSAPGGDTSDGTRVEALFEGVVNYGNEEVNRDNIESFRYRFLIDGKEKIFRIDPGEKNEDGRYTYPVQNRLKENYRFAITVRDDTVTEAKELPAEEDITYRPPVSGKPGERTIANFLRTAMEPVGTTLYVFGGGWDWQDEGAAVQARTLGVSADWVRFFNEQDENYTYRSKDGNEKNSDPATSYYPYRGFNEYYYAGLDCSGYIGWAVYNTLETENGKDGYVMGAVKMAKAFAGMGLGVYTPDVVPPSEKNGFVMKPGDMMSLNGHVWISLGTCSDGSVVIVHSTPAYSRTGQSGGGVELSAVGGSVKCEAYRLADRYMSRYYPEWYRRYPVKLGNPKVYFRVIKEPAGRFTWNPRAKGGLSDPEHIADMQPAQVLAFLFESAPKSQ